MEIETFLEQLELGNYIDTFKESGYELGILKEKSDDELRTMIVELNLPSSTQDLIITKIQTLKKRVSTMLFKLFIDFTFILKFIL